MADRLAEKGFRTAVAERVLDRLTEVGLIDDAAFAQQWVRSRHTYSGKGKKVLAEELRRKGIAPEDAEPALESVTAEDERARAGELVRRKLVTLPADMERDKAISRLVAMLARRGYTPGTAYGVVTSELAVLGEQRAEEQSLAPEPSSAAPESSTSGDSDGFELDTRGRSSRAKRTPARHHPTSAALGSAADGTDSAADSADSATDDFDSATALIRAKLRTLSPNLDRATATRRLVGLLARRGYDSATAYRVVAAALAESHDGNSSHDAPPPRTSRLAVSARKTGSRAADSDESNSDESTSAESAFDELSEPVDDEHTRATELARANLRKIPAGLDREKAIRRLVGMLARRGISQSIAYTVVKAELSGALSDSG